MTDYPENTPSNTSVVRQTFAGDELAVQHETAGSAVAARAKAQIEARYIMALKRPRSWDDVRTRLLKECKRPGFARAARYRKPVGQGIEGPSIRFAEAALRYMTNVSVETTVTYDDPTKVILRVSVVDLEANVPYEQDVAVQKTVERKKLGRGQRPLAQRTNSFGDTVYIVEATDDEILNKVNALVSKALRTLALRLLPGDILEECMDLCIRVARDEDARDPDAARKAMVDAYFALGIAATQLVEYLGHPLEALAPKELDELRALYAALRDGETSWQEIMDARDTEPSEQKNGATKKVDELLEKHKAKASEKKKPAAAAKGQTAHDPETGEIRGEEEPREPGSDG
jgi:hypothetical protein